MKRDKRQDGATYLNCTACMSENPRQPGRNPLSTRAGWRCGWLSEEDRAPKSRRRDPLSWGCTSDDLCPGYLIRLPQVEEAANAHVWFKEGQLGLRENVPDLLQLAVSTLNQELAEAESEALAKAHG